MVEYALSFLEEDFKKIAKFSKDAEKLIVEGMEEHAIFVIGQVAEMISKKICTLKGLKNLIKDENGKFINQFERISALSDKKIINNKIFHWFYDILKKRNTYTHPEEDKNNKNSLKLAKVLHKQLFKIAQWFAYEFADNLKAKNLDYPGIIYKNEKSLPPKLKKVDNKVDSLIENIELESENNLNNEEEKIKIELTTLTNQLLTLKEKIHNNDFEIIESQQIELIQDVKRMKNSIEKIASNSNIENVKKEYMTLTSILEEIHLEMEEISKNTKYNNIKTQNLQILKNIEELEEKISKTSHNEDIELIKKENKNLIMKIQEIEDKITSSLNKHEEIENENKHQIINNELTKLEETYRKYYPPSLEYIKKENKEFVVYKKREIFGRYDNIDDAIKARDELINNNWAFIGETKKISTYIYQLNKKFIIKANIKNEERVFGVFDDLKLAENAENEAMMECWQLNYILFNKFDINKKYKFDL